MRTASRCGDGIREADAAIVRQGKGLLVGSLSIWHWIVVIFIIAQLASPIMGIVRGVKNQSVLNAILSVLIPLYGLIYFFVAKRPVAA
jgi:hypothetical protein